MNAMRTALVTGANRGLGLEISRQLVRSGYRVLLTARAQGAGAAAARALQKVGPGTVDFRRLDVADEVSVASLAERLAKDEVSLDVLVNNAGIALDGFDVEVARRTLDVNFFGPMHVTDALLSRIALGGRVVMVSSGMGELSCLAPPLRERLMDPGLTRKALVGLMQSFVRDVERGRHAEAGWPSSAYRVSKAGLNALVRILARELGGRRILVNAVCPGWVRTDMGGASASRGVKKGAASIVWAAVLEDETTGGFFRDGKPIPW
jgi:NAD(P)-dependent dehydrogenase (short-subunit alcohol dehydrogenase family)